MTTVSANMTVVSSGKVDSAIRTALESWKLLPLAHRVTDTANVAELYLRTLKPPISGSQEIPILHVEHGELSWTAAVRELAWDSEFFGFGVGKIEPLIPPRSQEVSRRSVELGSALIRECLTRARSCGMSQLSTQAHCSDTTAHQCLEANGFLLADTIVCYELELAQLPTTNRTENIRVAEVKDIDALSKISGECFSNRQHNANRFNGDVQFPPAGVRLLYEQWIQNSVAGPLADRVFVCVEDGAPVGFITAKLPTDGEIALGIRLGRIPLNAVHPQYQRRGIYTKLVRVALHWFAAQPVDAVEIRTQLPNSGVHSCWQSLGGRISSTYHTFHKNLGQECNADSYIH